MTDAAATLTPNQDNRKLVVIGSGGVGKSALTLQYVHNRFLEEHDPTIEDSYQKYVTVDDILCRLEILDTAGQEEYKDIRATYLRQGDGYLLVYSINSRESYDEVRSLYNQIVRSKGDDKDLVCMVLVGNKTDLEAERVVSRQEGEELALELGAAFYETSAKKNILVEACFEELIRRCRALGALPCTCQVNDCTCYDRCKTCNRTRNTHHKAPFKHKFVIRGPPQKNGMTSMETSQGSEHSGKQWWQIWCCAPSGTSTKDSIPLS